MSKTPDSILNGIKRDILCVTELDKSAQSSVIVRAIVGRDCNKLLNFGNEVQVRNFDGDGELETDYGPRVISQYSP